MNSALSFELTSQDLDRILDCLPDDAVETLAVMADLEPTVAHRLLQLLGFGSRATLLAFGMAEEQGEERTLALLPAGEALLGAAADRDSGTVSLSADEALERARRAAASIPVDAGSWPSRREAAAAPATDPVDAPPQSLPAALLDGVVDTISEPLGAVSITAASAGAAPKTYIAYSRLDRDGRTLEQGERVRILPATDAQGLPVAAAVFVADQDVCGQRAVASHAERRRVGTPS